MRTVRTTIEQTIQDMAETMEVKYLLRTLDFNQPATISELYYGPSPTSTRSISINGNEAKSLIKIMDRLGIHVTRDADDASAFRVPYDSLWSFGTNFHLAANTIQQEEPGFSIMHRLRELVPIEGSHPHSYRVTALAKVVDDDVASRISPLFGRDIHTIDFQHTKHHAEVIAAALYIEGMLNHVIESTSTKASPHKFFQKINLCESEGLLQSGTTQILHALRKARNSAAHDLDMLTQDEDNTKGVRVESNHKDFINNVRSVIDLAKDRYDIGTVRINFRTAIALTAGEINKSAQMAGSTTLGFIHPDELDDLFA